MYTLKTRLLIIQHMQVLLLLTALTLGRRGKIVVRGTTVTLQVVEGQVRQVGNLVHAEILEGLGRGVDLLVNELALDLVGGHGVPPEVFVEVVGEGLEEGLGNVNVGALLDDFTVDQLGNLRGGVVLGTVELEGLTNGAVIVQHLLKGGTDVNGLKKSELVMSRLVESMVSRDLRGPASSAPACGWQ